MEITLWTDRLGYRKVCAMNLKVWGAHTLTNFTQCISQAIARQLVLFESSEPYQYSLAQIHGSPNSIKDDEFILKETLAVDFPVLFLLHRPDEL